MRWFNIPRSASMVEGIRRTCGPVQGVRQVSPLAFTFVHTVIGSATAAAAYHGLCSSLQVGTLSITQVAASPTQPPALFVKVGDGPYVHFDPPTGTAVMAMRKGAFVKAVRQDDTFAKSTEGMAQDQCIVSVVASMERVQPTAEEVALSKVLEGMQTLGEVVQAWRPATSGCTSKHLHELLPRVSPCDFLYASCLTLCLHPPRPALLCGARLVVSAHKASRPVPCSGSGYYPAPRSGCRAVPCAASTNQVRGRWAS
jgi:hypothetical protein